MLDPKIIQGNSDRIKKMLKDRAVDFDLDSFINADKKRRELIIKTDELRKKRNQTSIEFAQKKKAGEDTGDLINKMKNSLQELEKLEKEQVQAESNYAKLAFTIPNLIHESVPVGDKSANKEIRKMGDVPKFDFRIQDHVDISKNLDLVDLERAAKTAGSRFFYLKNELVKLNQALIQYALDMYLV